MLAALARFDIRFRWLVVFAWIVAVVVAGRLLPNLAAVTQSNNALFLPANSPSQQAATLAAPFKNPNAGATAVIVAVRSDGPLIPEDRTALAEVERVSATVPGVTQVRDLGTSADGQAGQALVVTDAVGLSNAGNPVLVGKIRQAFTTAGAPPGLAFHLTGPLATATDAASTSAQTGSRIRFLTVLFVVALLFIVYRAVLAPVLTLVPAVLALLLAEPLIATVDQWGLQASPATGTLLPVLLLGAGADYGLFLVFRLREEIRQGASPEAALVTAMGRVGLSISFSAISVVAALLCLLLASFGLYRGLGPSLAIGVAVLLLAALTLLPALLSIFGRLVFWPSHPHAGEATTSTWGRVAARAVRRPLILLAAGVAIFALLASGLANFRTGGFTTAPANGTDSGAGAAALAAHFPAAASNSDTVVLRFSSPVQGDTSALGRAEQVLAADPTAHEVRGPLDPNGRALISADGQTVEFNVVPAAGAPGSQAAIAAIPKLRAAAARAAASSGAAAVGVVGLDATAYDIEQLSQTDLAAVVPVVLLAIAVLLAVLLRSLVAPVYLIVTVALSFLVALGFSSFVFIHITGDDGLNFVIPILLFIFAMALGEDYNILLMTRVREEAHDHAVREALVRAVGFTGGTITAAGLILAGTFAVLAFAGGSDQSRQLGFTIAFAILLDTFFVRTLLVPAVAVMLGRWNWWPSRLSQAP